MVHRPDEREAKIYAKKEKGMKPSEMVKMSHAEFEAEHKRLLKVLKNPTKAKVREEYRKQKAEVRERGR